MGEKISNKVVHEATSRSWSEWFQVLENAPVRDAEESEVQAWLTEHHAEIGGWWCQVITRRWSAQKSAAVTEPV